MQTIVTEVGERRDRKGNGESRGKARETRRMMNTNSPLCACVAQSRALVTEDGTTETVPVVKGLPTATGLNRRQNRS
jgi:hypothetical protein